MALVELDVKPHRGMMRRFAEGGRKKMALYPRVEEVRYRELHATSTGTLTMDDDNKENMSRLTWHHRACFGRE